MRSLSSLFFKQLFSVTVKKEKGAKPKEKKEDHGFDSLVASYKSKISAGLKLL